MSYPSANMGEECKGTKPGNKVGLLAQLDLVPSGGAVLKQDPNYGDQAAGLGILQKDSTGTMEMPMFGQTLKI